MARFDLALVIAIAACGSPGASGDAGAVDAPRNDANGDAAARALPYRGVNLSGAEFGQQNVPGTFGTDYIYPDPAYASGYTSPDYFVGKGMTTFRLPFKWQRLQRSLNASFDADELARLRTTVANLTGKGAYVILDPHDFARYAGNVIGSTQVPNAAFADLWAKLAAEFATNERVIFGLMNEPHDMPTEQWRDAANAAIAAIRGAGAHQLVLVPGNAYTGAWSWTNDYYGTPNAVAMLGIADPEDHYAFEVHQYLDADYSGTNTSCQSTTIGAESLTGFTQWLKQHGKRAVLGEVGSSVETTCLTAIDGALDHLEANTDVWLGWLWWSAGPWWGNYFMTLEPSNGNDAPQLAALVPHLAFQGP